MRNNIPKENKQKIIELYLSGLGSDTIAKQFNIHPNTVLKILKKNGIERRGLRKKIQLSDEQKIIELYLSGISAPKIAEQFNISDSMILRYLKKNNVERRSAEEVHRIYKINEDFFDVIDTQEKTYVLGFLYADGYNSLEGNCIRIDLSTKDRDILEKIASLIFVENPLDHIKDIERIKKLHEEEKTYYFSYLNIHSKHICQRLNELGCTKAKSLNLKFPEWLTDPELQRHFIRGYYDGDGGVYVSDEKRKMCSMRIISTYEFCVSIKEIIELQAGINIGKLYNPKNMKGKNLYRTGMSGNRQIEKFLNWLYQDSKIHLNRKYDLYLKLIDKNKETDKIASIGTRGFSKKYIKEKEETNLLVSSLDSLVVEN